MDAYVGLGANLGDAEGTVRAALGELGSLPRTRLVAASALYRTRAWGRRDQPDFVNAVAALETGLAPRALLDALLQVERRHGRTREAGGRWGPRTLDLDLLLHGDAVLDEPGLQLPHPQMHLRAFVMHPLAEIAPDAIVPAHGRAADLAAALAPDGMQALR